MWVFVLLGIVGGALAALLLGVAVQNHRRRIRYAHALQQWQARAESSNGHRPPDANGIPEGSHALEWYLNGTTALRTGQTRQAARAFGAAHHGDPNFETAALLTFACLKARDGQDSDILEQIVQTWMEMKRPDLLVRSEDRLIMDAMANAEGPMPSLSPLGRLAWCVVSADQRRRLESLLQDDTCEWARPFRG